MGLSEVGVDTIRRAHAVHPISWMKIEYSLFNRGIELDILQTLRELGISLSAYGVLSRGLLSGSWSKERVLGSDDKRRNGSRFSSQNLERTLALVEALRKIAEEKQAIVAQLAVQWRGSYHVETRFSIGRGAKTRALWESLGALNLNLNQDDISQIEAAVPSELVAGEYYPVPREKWFI